MWLTLYSASLGSAAAELQDGPYARTGERMKREKRPDSHEGGRVEKVPGGWRLKGDERVYRFNPLVPADKEAPFPPDPKAPRTRNTPHS